MHTYRHIYRPIINLYIVQLNILCRPITKILKQNLHNVTRNQAIKINFSPKHNKDMCVYVCVYI